jgi:hypothetical protein
VQCKEVTVDFAFITAAVKNYTTVIGFIDNGQLTEILSTVADVHFEAAHDALAKMEKAKDREACVYSAITHLESAHVAYRKLYQGERIGFRAASYELAVNMDIYTLCLMAVCYMYVTDVDLAKESVKNARLVFNDFESLKRKTFNKPTTMSMPGGEVNIWEGAVLETALNPLQWGQFITLRKYRMTEDRQKAFEQFCKTIDTHTVETFSSKVRPGDKLY